MTDLTIVVTSAGAQPTPPATLNANLIAKVEAVVPGYTADLPGSLIEDISSTDTTALVQCDSSVVETINSLTPYGANEFLLSELGQMLGIMPGAATNTSVYVVFSGNPGVVIAKGFTVSDGTYQYLVTDGGVIGGVGTSSLLYAVATIPGSWAIPSGSVNQLITSAPPGLTSVTNPSAGTPATSAETAASYRSRVLQANLASSQGMARYLKTLVQAVSGVQARLVSVQQQTSGGWEIVVGGGDPYEVAYAIYDALFDVSTLVGNTLSVTNITQANPGVVTTATNHNYQTGQICQINNIVGMTELNGVNVTVTVVNDKTFSVGLDTTSYNAYVSGGVVTPNLINQLITLQDYPDVYAVRFGVPPQQQVAVTVTWNTTATNFVSTDAISQAAQPALVSYINTIPVGQPINLFELQSVFQLSVEQILPPALLTRMVFAVSINGIGVSPESGTGIIAGDSQSYFETASNLVVINQG